MAIVWSASSMPASIRPSIRAWSVWNADVGAQRRVREALEHPVRLRHPASADGTGKAAECLVRELERDPRRVLGAAGILVARERALECLGGLVGMPGPPRGGPQQLEIVGREPAVLVGRGQRVHRVGPRMPPDGVPAKFKRRDHLVERTVYLGRGVRATGS